MSPRQRRNSLRPLVAICTTTATVGSDVGRPGASPPIFEHSGVFQPRAPEKLALLPLGSAIAAMLSDPAVMREHARAGRLSIK